MPVKTEAPINETAVDAARACERTADDYNAGDPVEAQSRGEIAMTAINKWLEASEGDQIKLEQFFSQTAKLIRRLN